jgi:hypothetical protein
MTACQHKLISGAIFPTAGSVKKEVFKEISHLNKVQKVDVITPEEFWEGQIENVKNINF